MSLKSIGRLAFHNCIQIKDIVLPQGITYIGEKAFSGCISLSTVSVPEGVREITTATFAGCHSLTEVFLPSSVTTIHSDAFRGCRKLRKIHLDRIHSSDLRLYHTAFFDVHSACLIYVHVGEMCNIISVNALNHTQRYMDIPYLNLIEPTIGEITGRD